MGRQSFLVCLIVLFCCTSVEAAVQYKMRHNPQTGRGDWVVDVDSSAGSIPILISSDGASYSSALRLIFQGATITDLGSGVFSIAFGEVVTQYLLDPDGTNLTDPDGNNLIWGN